jgi:hypothetical protein
MQILYPHCPLPVAKKHSGKNRRTLSGFLLGLLVSLTLQAAPFSVSLGWMEYQSFSQQSTSIPMQAGYPLIKAAALIPGLQYRYEGNKVSHTCDFSFTNKAALSTRGSALLLDEHLSTIFRSSLDYRLAMPLFSWNSLTVRHAFLSGLNYENRLLTYRSGAGERTRDLNLYIGPGFDGTLRTKAHYSLRLFFDARFYLPYLNYGYLQDTDTQGNVFFAHTYRAFYYQTWLGLEIAYQLAGGDVLHIGIAKDDIVGFGNRRPLFYPDDIIHYKLERNFHVYLRYDLNTLKVRRREE